MRDIPTGVVTFVFTDIEGSTALIHEIGQLWIDVLAEHNAVLRQAWADHGGVEIKTEGDAFFVAFTDPAAALEACAQGQLALAAAEFSHGRPVRVRMGMHTGEAAVVEDDYVGIDVHEAARVAGAAHGGQILITATTWAAAEPTLRAAASPLGIQDLGRHRLKDFNAPRPLLQLTGPGLETIFPPPRTTTARSHNLPAPPSALVGRAAELELLQRSAIGDARLVTVTGGGGLGKTRLATELAWSVLGWFREGVWFADLAAVGSAAAIPDALIDALGVTERPGASSVDLLVEHLGRGPTLLVLDTLEHLADDDDITVVSDLLAACPELTIVATSRERLRLRGEHEIPIDGLPDDDATALFEARALAADPHFSGPPLSMAKVCRMLDGIPLAIELAAARVRKLDLDDLLAGLSQTLDLLTEGDRDLPARQRTMEAAVRWSWDLCEDDERAVLATLAVFAESAGPEAIAQVHGSDPDDALGRVCDRSMAVRGAAAGSAGSAERFRLLLPVRHFVRSATPDDEQSRLEDAHAAWCAALAQRCGPALIGRGQVDALDRLDAELAEFPVAVERMDVAQAVATVAAAGRWWVLRGHLRAGRAVISTVLERAERGERVEPLDPQDLARAVTWAADIASLQGDTEWAESLIDRTEETLGAQSANAAAVNSALANIRGEVLRRAGRTDEAGHSFRSALRAIEAAGEAESRLAGIVRGNLGAVAHARAVAVREEHENADAVFAEARDHWQVAVDVLARWGDDHGVLQMSANLAVAALEVGDYDAARAELERNRALAAELGATHQAALTEQNLGLIASMEGESEDVDRHYAEALRLFEELELPRQAAEVLFRWGLFVPDGPDLSGPISRVRRAVALADSLGDAAAAEWRSVLDRLEELEAERRGAAPPPSDQPTS